MKAHGLALHRVSSLYIIPCNQCWEWFPTKEEMETHTIYHGIDPTKLYCNLCSETFKAQFNDGSSVRFKSLRTGQHVLNRHLKKHDEIIECSTCGLKCVSKLTLQTHMKTHNAKHMCDICSKNLRTAELVAAHIKRDHEENVMLDCDECEMKSKNIVGLKYHKSRMHGKYFIKVSQLSMQ